ncbi:MFS transporter [Komagataeibacter nataicola]|uniref:MFS transporter n=1 Tax=Komagataeibacter nataicola TaxID=265960 RepID=A0A9N7CPN0_9PROT|nr:sugar porter family MFS transporter [Komagataeibacter nataicola]AQU88444.1 MFS transporter [Komagataeibacter nataicola]PYD67141.1 MFS transporter [Komagataeibacter nataicola]WNM08833.1 sugar porter family MFS transporter [Komagataeibacter nataicola]GBR17394.1 major facilitator superfamily sugar transporter [Komagataeibacter nataicola NRIC 0616]
MAQHSQTVTGSGIVNLIAGVAATGGLLFGYDTGIISAALLQITPDFSLGTLGQQVVTSAIVAGALAGCLMAAPLSDRLGRRYMIMFAALVFIVGTLVASFAPGVEVLVAARFILGLAVGMCSQIVPVYIAEIAPREKRGQMVVLFQLAVVTGILVSFIVGYLCRAQSWRLMFGLGIIPAVILFGGMSLLPRSPRWLAMKGKLESAFDVLQRLRRDPVAARAELDAIVAMHDEQAPWSALLQPWVRPAVVASVGVALFCQITGINAVLYYAPTIFAGVGFGEGSALLTSIAIGVAMVISTAFGSWAVDAWGRRRLLLRLVPGAAVSLMVLAAMFAQGATHGINTWITAAAVVCYAIFNVGSLSVAIWLVGAEVYPLSCRSKGMSLVAATHWTADLLISLTTLSLVQALGAAGTFCMYAGLNVLAFVFIWRYVPETWGRSLEEIETALKAGTFDRLR